MAVSPTIHREKVLRQRGREKEISRESHSDTFSSEKTLICSVLIYWLRIEHRESERDQRDRPGRLRVEGVSQLYNARNKRALSNAPSDTRDEEHTRRAIVAVVESSRVTHGIAD